VRIDFSRPGKPTDNAYIETSNGSLRYECLDLHWFAMIAEAQGLIRDGNTMRADLTWLLVTDPRRIMLPG
jgi:transposase InsO family protein